MTSFIIKIINGEKSAMLFGNADGCPPWICEIFDCKSCRTVEGALKMCRYVYRKIEDKKYLVDYYYELLIEQKRIDIFDGKGNFIESYKCRNI